MGRVELKGNPPISILLRRSARARQLSLRVSSLDGRVTMTIPRGVSERAALGFARDREDWLRQHLGSIAPETRVAIGATIPIGDQPVQIVAGSGRSITFDGRHLAVPGNADRAGARVRGWLKVEARQRIAARCDAHAGTLGKRYRRLTLRDTRSRWGSCSSDGDLMLSWRLIMAPPEVLDYVCAHEVAHLVEMNHSDAFWAVTAQLCPDWRRHRDWLRAKGQQLHRIRFEDRVD